MLYSNRAVRMCVGCHQRFLQSQLLRLIYDEDSIKVFSGMKRSFYFCQECLKNEKRIIVGLSCSKKSKPKPKHIIEIQEIADRWMKK